MQRVLIVEALIFWWIRKIMTLKSKIYLYFYGHFSLNPKAVVLLLVKNGIEIDDVLNFQEDNHVKRRCASIYRKTYT